MKNRRQIPVDLEMLALALEGNHGEGTWYIDLTTGEVLTTFDDPEAAKRVKQAPKRYLAVDAFRAPSEDFRAMERFVAELEEGEAQRDLERALRRAKPFRNFREALHDWPEVLEQWHAVRAKRSEAAVRAWLEDNGIEAVPRAQGN